MHSSPCSPSSGKRDRSSFNSAKSQDSLQELPAIPRLLGEVILDVFTHHSLRQPPNASTSAQGATYAYQNERLMELGRNVLTASATRVLFAMKPFLSAEDIAVRRDEILSTANVENLIQLYKLREKLRCHPDAISSLHAPEEARRLFDSYFGAVYAEGGFEKICEWMSSLLEMGLFEAASRETPAPCARESPPPKKVKVVESSVIPPRLLPRPRFLPSATSTKPPLSPVPSASAGTPNPLAPAQPHLPFLQSFNQTAQQRQVEVVYTAAPSEPPSVGQWTVKCVANGIEVGIGHGVNKQIAKEDAARQAFYAMGWAPHG